MPPPSILYAEDDDSFRHLSALLLKKHCQVTVQTAASREEALRIIEEATPQEMPVAITDLRMPNLGDGEAVAEAAFAKGMNVIIISGSLEELSDEVRRRCRAVFNKSYGIQPVFETLKECLANR